MIPPITRQCATDNDLLKTANAPRCNLLILLVATKRQRGCVHLWVRGFFCRATYRYSGQDIFVMRTPTWPGAFHSYHPTDLMKRSDNSAREAMGKKEYKGVLRKKKSFGRF